MSRPTDDAPPPRKRKPTPEPHDQDAEMPSAFVPNPKRPVRSSVPQAENVPPTTFKPARKTKKSSDDMPVRDVNPGKNSSWYERILFGRVNSGQLAVFCRQFSAYQDAGVDMSKSLVNLQRQFARTSLGPVISRLSLAVKRGDSFGEAVEREPQAFDAMFVGMIRVAEARGGIPETLRLLSRHYENRQTLMRQARSAMIYPIAVLLFASGVVALMTIWIIPMFVDMLREMAGPNAALPLPTKMLMAFSDFVKTIGWFMIPLVLIGTPVFLLWFYKTPAGKPLIDRVMMIIPVFGQLLKKLDITRFARSLSALLGAGVDVGTSLELAGEVVTLDPFRRAVRSTRSMVIQGSELSVAMDETGRFGPDVIAVVNSGEETGKLPETLDKLADDYEEQVAYMIRNMGQLVQPLLMVVIGGIVLFIILAVFLPYISIITSLTGAH